MFWQAASVTNVNGQIARQATGGVQSIGTATVSGAGSHWNNTGTLFVGINGDGMLNVESGGLVSSNTAVLGLNSGGSSGTATVTGAGSHWDNSGDMLLGFFTNTTSGTLNIVNDGEVTVGGTMTLFDPGTVNFSGGKLDVGTLDLSSGAGTTDNFNMTGGRLVVDQVEGNFKQEGGVLAPGDNSIGVTSIGLDLELIASLGNPLPRIEFEIGGATLFDRIDVGGGDPGNANLDGIMDVDLTGYAPVDGDSFELFFTSGGMISLGSNFGFDFSDASLTSGLAWDTSAFGSDGIISVTSAVPEPTSFAMFGVACSFMVRRRRARLSGTAA